MNHAELMQAQDGWSPEQLHDWQRERARELIAHAAANSRFWQARVHGPELEDVEPATKRELMDAGSAAFCGPVPDGTLTFSTGGSSRLRGTFYYTPSEWETQTAIASRVFEFQGVPLGSRMAFLVGPAADTMLAGVARHIAKVAVPRPFDITRPLEEVMAQLEAFQPDILTGYSSAIALMAGEQLAGRLRIAPRAVTWSSEPHTPVMTERARAAWGVEPGDLYAATEAGVIAIDCTAHEGLHVMAANVLIEVEDYRVLVTNLHNRLQPIIRYELQDRVAWTGQPCSCGRPHPLLTAVYGRVDDVLELGVPVHPTAFVPLAKLAGVREFQVDQHGDDLVVRVVPTNGDISDAVRATVGDILASAGARAASVTVEQADTLQRTPTGKLRLVRRV